MEIDMCGRIANTLPTDAMAQLFAASPSNDLPEVPNFNICPTNAVHTVYTQDGVRRLQSMRWGFIPSWYKTPNDGPLLINARGETIAEKPAFKEACRTQRCVIVATGFYEWTKDADGGRNPYYLSRTDGALIAFAGVWQSWGKGEIPLNTCAIVTTSANTTISNIHHRMPVMLEPEQVSLWLGEKGKGAATLMRAAPEETLTFHKVSREVNSRTGYGSQLLEPIA
jgi:putative SOS response-associated peptidase YedK